MLLWSGGVVLSLGFEHAHGSAVGVVYLCAAVYAVVLMKALYRDDVMK